MPGVPTSRGCNACRQQKKKCDETRPTCSRCARLHLVCVGAGQRRYKFHNHTVAETSRSGPSGPSRPPLADRDVALVVRRAPSPSAGPETRVAGRLVAALDVRDPRFDLTVYGDFVLDMPRRYGTSSALDAALAAMAVSLPLVHAAQAPARPTEPMLRAYGRALQALRLGLGRSTADVDTANTLCALYLVVICQGWMPNEDELFPSHGEAVANILHSTKGHTRVDDSFAHGILATLLFLVIMESLINPRIRLDPDLWDLPETFGPRSAADEPICIDTLANRRLARTVTLIRDPRAHLHELVETYARVLADRARLAPLLEHGMWATPLPFPVRRMHVQWQAGFGMLTLLAMRLNGVLQTSPGHCLTGLAAHVAEFVDSIITLAEGAVQYRPLGSSSMPLYLLAAYAALSPDEDARSERICGLLAMYRPGLDVTRLLSGMLVSSGAKLGDAPQAVHYEGFLPCEQRRGISADGCLDEAMSPDHRVEERTISRADICCIL